AAGAEEDLLQQPGAAVGDEAQLLQGLVERLAADQGGERPDLACTGVGEAMAGAVLHGYIRPYLAGPAAALALPPDGPLKTRVGANSPSLWPTMSSVTNTFVNCLPLCTRNVTPMKSGTIVQSRAQVLIGSRLPVRCPFSTLASSRGS